ncbi:MAG: UvrB/UvrC motif-containing protein, partial [Myxococcales bacterium]|nr:UvrB/UvrC motif-containing protein [Myxococcales bacterium]
YNQQHGITPRTVRKRISSIRDSIWEHDYVTVPARGKDAREEIPGHELPELIESLRREMGDAVSELAFERAAELRDRIQALEAERLRMF